MTNCNKGSCAAATAHAVLMLEACQWCFPMRSVESIVWPSCNKIMGTDSRQKKKIQTFLLLASAASEIEVRWRFVQGYLSLKLEAWSGSRTEANTAPWQSAGMTRTSTFLQYGIKLVPMTSCRILLEPVFKYSLPSVYAVWSQCEAICTTSLDNWRDNCGGCEETLARRPVGHSVKIS